MHRTRRLVFLLGLCAAIPPLPAQAAGARGGVVHRDDPTRPAPIDPARVGKFIEITGRAEVRVAPTRVRVVLGLVGSGDTAPQAREGTRSALAALLPALDQAGVPHEAVTTDFISILPVYEWQLESQEGKEVAVERLVGHRAQENVHVLVPDDATALAVVDAAASAGVTDVIAFDYWAETLDAHKAAARRKALAAAKANAELLLDGVFAVRPRPINVDESTRTVFPNELYRSFESTHSSEMQNFPWMRNAIPRIGAVRPRNTYYEGFFGEVDTRPAAMPDRPMISIVSTVRIYYAPPL